MKKSLLAIGLVAMLGLSACACGGHQQSANMNCPNHKAGQTCACKECKKEHANCKCKHKKEMKGCAAHAKPVSDY